MRALHADADREADRIVRGQHHEQALRPPPPPQHHHHGAVAWRHAVRARLAGADPRRAAVGGLQRPVASGVHRNDAAAGLRRRPAQPDHRQPGPDHDRRRDRHADRHPGRHLHGGIRPPRQADDGGALHQRHPAQRAVDRHRPVHLRGDGLPDGPLLRLGRRGGAGGDRHPGGGAHHRGHADRWCRIRCARRRPRSACRAR